MSAFHNTDNYPAIARLCEQLKTHAEWIAKDGYELAQKASFTKWHESCIHNGNWFAHGIKWQGVDIDGEGAETVRCILHEAGDLVRHAGYSLMLPHTEITTHRGYSDTVLRLHLGLFIPDGDCGICVAGETRHWAPGELLLFDDTQEHHAYNRTDQGRLVLLLDLERSKLET